MGTAFAPGIGGMTIIRSALTISDCSIRLAIAAGRGFGTMDGKIR
jgi:hypothetical protein